MLVLSSFFRWGSCYPMRTTSRLRKVHGWRVFSYGADSRIHPGTQNSINSQTFAIKSPFFYDVRMEQLPYVSALFLFYSNPTRMVPKSRASLLEF